MNPGRSGEEYYRRYQIYVPNGYCSERSWPLILFLHGAGEGGEDGLLQTEFQLGSAIRRHADLFQAVVVFPQQSRRCYWSRDDLNMVLQCLQQTCHDYRIDEERISLCGVSSGAIGAWTLACLEPRRFHRLLIVSGLVGPSSFIPAEQGIVPVGIADPYAWLAQRLGHVPTWIFHGDYDPLYPIDDARRTVSCLRSTGAPVRYSEIPGFGHNVWDIAFYSEAVAGWLLGDDAQPASGTTGQQVS